MRLFKKYFFFHAKQESTDKMTLKNCFSLKSLFFCCLIKNGKFQNLNIISFLHLEKLLIIPKIKPHFLVN